MNLALRTKQLQKLFSYDRDVFLEESQLTVKPYPFARKEGADEIACFQKELVTTSFCPITDDHIQENASFTYTIFTPAGKEQFKKAIILLHGLNERSWEKYLTWAEYLALHTGKPVILFPIAFHMNRAPGLWCNPREVQPWVKQRREEVGDCPNSTFVNLALSSRLSKHPLRFYASGRESAFNLCQLAHEIKTGQHPLFRAGTSVNIFAYSIGALLAQVVLLADPNNLFTDSRLFMFCGGSVFNHMNGNSREIMDKDAYDRLQRYFNTDFLHPERIPGCFRHDALENAFKAMIRPDVLPRFREGFFHQACNRIQAISLKRDVVMPTQGIIRALGKASEKILEELDFPFDYSHQKPFPKMSGSEDPQISKTFRYVFGKAAAFL